MDERTQFVGLLTSHQARLAVFVRSLIPDASAANDVLQETNLTLWRKADEFSLGTNFWAWASRVAYFEVRAYRSKLGREKCYFSDELIEKLVPQAEARREVDEARQTALEGCLKKLRSQDRDLIRRRYERNSSLATIARQINRSVEATRKLLQRTRQMLLTCIERQLSTEKSV